MSTSSVSIRNGTVVSLHCLFTHNTHKTLHSGHVSPSETKTRADAAERHRHGHDQKRTVYTAV